MAGRLRSLREMIENDRPFVDMSAAFIKSNVDLLNQNINFVEAVRQLGLNGNGPRMPLKRDYNRDEAFRILGLKRGNRNALSKKVGKGLLTNVGVKNDQRYLFEELALLYDEDRRKLAEQVRLRAEGMVGPSSDPECPPGYLTLAESAKALGLTPQQLDGLSQRGKIQHHEGRDWWFQKDELKRLSQLLVKEIYAFRDTSLKEPRDGDELLIYAPGESVGQLLDRRGPVSEWEYAFGWEETSASSSMAGLSPFYMDFVAPGHEFYPKLPFR